MLLAKRKLDPLTTLARSVCLSQTPPKDVYIAIKTAPERIGHRRRITRSLTCLHSLLHRPSCVRDGRWSGSCWDWQHQEHPGRRRERAGPGRPRDGVTSASLKRNKYRETNKIRYARIRYVEGSTGWGCDHADKSERGGNSTLSEWWFRICPLRDIFKFLPSTQQDSEKTRQPAVPGFGDVCMAERTRRCNQE